MAISNETKKQLAEEALVNLELQQYRQLLSLGHDPDVFDFSTIEELTTVENALMYKTITDLQTRIDFIKNLISSL